MSENNHLIDPELTRAEVADLHELYLTAPLVQDIWQSNCAAEDDLDRDGFRLPSEIAAGVHVTEAQYSAMVVNLLRDDLDTDEDPLYMVASNRDRMLTARNAGFEAEEIAERLSTTTDHLS